jgi:type II secretory pathway pseudopilin PulG
MFDKKRGQIWVETVIYTLISLVLIGLVLAFIVPKIQEIQDRSTIEQTIELMSDLEIVVSSIGDVAGNKRIVELGLNKGTLEINGESESLIFNIESEYEYSELGEEIMVGSIAAKTEKSGDLNIVTLTSYYSEYNLTYDGVDQSKEVPQSPTPYKLSIENKGSNGKVIIDMIIE